MYSFENIQKYFWDVDYSALEIKKDSTFIISRVLEYGDFPVVRWLLQTYSPDLIKQVLTTKQNFSRKSAQFWQQYFGLSQRDIPCLQKFSQKMPVPLWPH